MRIDGRRNKGKKKQNENKEKEKQKDIRLPAGGLVCITIQNDTAAIGLPMAMMDCFFLF
ncbi:MAG: hypothetical protein WAM14_00855 [Candidatus Nitrosopolaris sp.]